MKLKKIKKSTTGKIKPRQTKQEDLRKIRKFYHRKQNQICPILKMRFPESDMVVDHLHSRSAKSLQCENGSLIRGVIHRQANVLEGKITNSFIRYGLHKFGMTLPEFLRSLADYIEKSPLFCKKLVHPTEAPKSKILSKHCFNKLNKAYCKKYPKRKKLKFPKSKKLTKPLEALFKEFNIEITLR